MKKIVYLLLVMFAAGTALAQSVEFRVNMSIKAQEGSFNPDLQQVYIAGDFTTPQWADGKIEMTDADVDSIYTLTIDTLTVGDTLHFKFITLEGTSIGWEGDPDRQYVVPSGSSVYSVYFDRDSVVNASVTFTFSANMEFEIVSTRFNTARPDTLSVRGTFNGWSGNDIMSPSVSDPNYYEKEVVYQPTLGEVIEYKFAYINATGTAWEGGDNRKYTVTQSDISNGSTFIERTFDDLTLDNVTNNEVTIKFIVNMDSAKISQTGVPFSSIENVFIAGANAPLQWPTGGWPNRDSATIHFLYNDGTNGDEVADDSLWTIELTFPQYSALTIQYKYGANWGGDNGGSNDNEAPSGSDHFLNFSPDLLSATVHNQFGVTGTHELENVVVLGVEEIPNTVPKVYSLKQNYPNPFNPTTNIRFAIPDAGLVTLKIYNLLGQEVTTLVNEYKNAGTYNVDFNAVNLSSGVYFYQINAGNYSDTKKMILMK